MLLNQKTNSTTRRKVLIVLMALYLRKFVTSNCVDVGVFSGQNSFKFVEIIILCFAICELVHDVETIFHFRERLKASGNLFGNTCMSALIF